MPRGNAMGRWRPGLAAALVAVAALPPLSWWWEASLVRHMLVQIPMLVAAGVLLGGLGAVPGRRPVEGAAAVLLAVPGLMFWMMPRWLDAAVDSAAVDMAKFATLVAVAGIPLGWGWARLGPVGRAFLWAQAVSMAGALGILYATFPQRLCTSYLASEQEAMGRLLLAAAAALGLAGGLRALLGRPAPPSLRGRQGAGTGAGAGNTPHRA